MNTSKFPSALYMQVQEEMIRRANLHSGANRQKRVYSSKYALSSIVYCSKCGEIYRRIAWNNRGKHSTVWRCCTRVEHGPTACDAPTAFRFIEMSLLIWDCNWSVPVLLIAHSIYCGVTRTHPGGGSTCIKRTLRMKSWLADLKTGAKPKEDSAIPIALIILTA